MKKTSGLPDLDKSNEVSLTQLHLFITFIKLGLYEGTSTKMTGDCMMDQLFAIYLGLTRL